MVVTYTIRMLKEGDREKLSKHLNRNREILNRRLDPDKRDIPFECIECVL